MTLWIGEKKFSFDFAPSTFILHDFILHMFFLGGMIELKNIRLK
jgi:hypothetical protein